MKLVRPFLAVAICTFVPVTSAMAQNTSPLETFLGISRKLKPPAPLPAPEGLQDHVVNGKLVLSLDDIIRLSTPRQVRVLRIAERNHRQLTKRRARLSLIRFRRRQRSDIRRLSRQEQISRLLSAATNC